MRRRAACAAGLALPLLLVLFVCEPVRIVSDSMTPTLSPGTHVVLDKISYRFRAPHRGELVAFTAPDTGELTVKRVVAVAGDRVAMEDGVLRLNGKPQSEPYVNQREVDSEYYGPLTVPAGTILVMGDRRGESIDSRAYGPVATGRVVGRVIWDF